MIESKLLLGDLQKLVRKLQVDLRTRSESDSTLDAQLRSEYEQAKKAGRTAAAFAAWREEPLVQSAVAWTLGAVFVRFLEDNGLLDLAREPRRLLGGTTKELRDLAEAHYLDHIRAHPEHADDAFLLAVFEEVGRLPGGNFLFDRKHNPLFSVQLSPDGAKALRLFFSKQDATGSLLHDFADSDWGTRFLGDLYQDLSEEAKKRYALLQTPEFVEEFILDRTLTPAIEEFGWEAVRLIDPASGSGHFLLGAFARLANRRRTEKPGLPPAEVARLTLEQVFGVDLNPFAAAIARFRLLIAALKVAGLTRLEQAPTLRINVAVGDSLLHGRHPGRETADTQHGLYPELALHHHYEAEDAEDLARILGGRYHAVVANPPYITVKDAGLNELYRSRFATCKGKYSLVCPFMERLFDLSVQSGSSDQVAGLLGVIASNAFMKREYGSKLVEDFLPKWDLTHVIDTSGAYIPGHGTPTVILLARGRRPQMPTVRAVMGIRGEPSPPEDAAKGLVWTAIVNQVDSPGSQGEFVSVADIERERLARHPWSMGGGGAAELKAALEVHARPLHTFVDLIGVFGMTNADEVMLATRNEFLRAKVEPAAIRQLVIGDDNRDWITRANQFACFPYEGEALKPIETLPGLARFLWPCRTTMGNRATFSKGTYFSDGRPWWEWHQVTLERLRTPLAIIFAEVATHNHFVFERGGKVFKQTAPVIKFLSTATEEDHLGVLGVLNSSTGCFWLKQVCHCKGSTVDQAGARQRTDAFEDFYQLNGSNVAEFPLPANLPVSLARLIDCLAQRLSSTLPTALLATSVPTSASLDLERAHAASIRRRMIALQEELDWQVYALYGLIEEKLTLPPNEVPEIDLGERTFEIVLARKMAAGELTTTWFERHGSTPITDIPARWSEPYRKLVAKRIEAIETNRNVALIERPEYKRRWNSERWEEQEASAFRGWLLDRLERPDAWPEEDGAPVLQTTTRLSDRVRNDPEFRLAAELYLGRPDVPYESLVKNLCVDEGVPYLAALRYSDEGLRKRALWEETWDLQRREDKGENVGSIPVPPRYDVKDFKKSSHWRLRGKLDVPKEQFVLYPGTEREADPAPVIGWAGWDHLQRARALAAYYVSLKEEIGLDSARLLPLLAGLQELVPWLLQWHDEPLPDLGEGMGTYIRKFIEAEARALGVTVESLAAWRPEAKTRGRATKAGPKRATSKRKPATPMPGGEET